MVCRIEDIVMFHIRKEGGVMHNGFNFYPLSDKGSFGFIFRYGPKIPQTEFGSKTWSFRYSKTAKKLFVGSTKFLA